MIIVLLLAWIGFLNLTRGQPSGTYEASGQMVFRSAPLSPSSLSVLRS